jgi:hypothetical protein
VAIDASLGLEEVRPSPGVGIGRQGEQARRSRKHQGGYDETGFVNQHEFSYLADHAPTHLA